MIRQLVLLLGDHLHPDPPGLGHFDSRQDAVLMIEAAGEAAHVWSHKARIALFLSAMRHRAAELRADGLTVHYLALEDASVTAAGDGLCDRLAWALQRYQPQRLVMVEAGEWRLARAIEATAQASQVDLQVLQDPHFLCAHGEFEAWARGRRHLLMENFYRMMRRREGVLLEDGEPAGGTWNYDAENRSGFGAKGPREVPQPLRCPPDALTQQVLALVEARFPDHPGSLAAFAWPVCRADALAVLQDFIAHRLAGFGTWQDAMWTGQPFLWHSLLSPALNLKLLDPREVIGAAEAAWRSGQAPLAAVEGFIRQILGWREFIRGVYWLDMPGMATANHFGHDRPLPAWYWTGNTRMRCLGEAVRTTLDHGYAHHIQRLMLTGIFGLLAGIAPQAVADWYLAVYVDAIEWVELPNVAGMALYANGGRFTSKPYIAGGGYVKRMSNYCQGCAYRPDVRTGPTACPLTQLYWHFVARHAAALGGGPRTALMVRNYERLPEAERAQITAEALARLADLDAL